jgi:hypothetical protein
VTTIHQKRELALGNPIKRNHALSLLKGYFYNDKVLIYMKESAGKLMNTFRQYPFSIAGFIFSLIPWLMVYIALIRIYLQPAAKGIQDHRSEFLFFGIVVALLIAVVLLAITTINLIFRDDKTFYIKLILLTIASNLFLYTIGMFF